MISRRTFVGTLAGGLLAAPLAAEAQPAGKMPRVLVYASDAMFRDRIVEGLRDFGWIEGRDVIVEWRRAEPPEDPALVDELGRLHGDVVVLGGPLRIRRAMNITQSTPLVGVDLESDPVASGFVKSLARPGSNVSGVWMDLPELAGKQLQFLREVAPRLSRLGVLRDDRIGDPQFTETQ